MFNLNTNKKSAFTLVEILIVIAILAILAVVTFVVIDPATRIQAANDTRVRDDVNNIADAINLYLVDNVGALPQKNDDTAIPTTTEAALFDAEASGGGTDLSNLSDDLSPTYLPRIPTEPDGDQYKVGQTAAGIVLVGGGLSSGTFVLSL